MLAMAQCTAHHLPFDPNHQIYTHGPTHGPKYKYKRAQAGGGCARRAAGGPYDHHERRRPDACISSSHMSHVTITMRQCLQGRAVSTRVSPAGCDRSCVLSVATSAVGSCHNVTGPPPETELCSDQSWMDQLPDDRDDSPAIECGTGSLGDPVLNKDDSENLAGEMASQEQGLGTCYHP